jgi:putative FmdB family regulatory protein
MRMPLYEYTCQKCEHSFEELVFGGESVACPECQSEHVERLISVPAAPQTTPAGLPMACQSEGPPCGAPWCRRK